MYREWSIADGPADKKAIAVGQTRPFTVLRPDGTPVRVLIDITSVDDAQGHICSFGGRLHYNRDIIDVVGNYSTKTKTGKCQTFPPAA